MIMQKRPSSTWLLLGSIGCTFFLTCLFLDTGHSSPRAQSLLDDQDRDVIEALFFGTGVLGAGACPARQRWAAFPRKSHIRVIVSSNVSADKQNSIQAALEQVSVATVGTISVSLHMTDDDEPVPQPFQVTSMTHHSPSLFGCVRDVGCTIHTWQAPGVLRSSRAIQPKQQTPQAYAHDVIGHGVLGMCHIQAKGIHGPEHSLMSGGEGVFSGQISGRLTELDMKALQAVYSSNLLPGATRQDFIQAGLINP